LTFHVLQRLTRRWSFPLQKTNLIANGYKNRKSDERPECRGRRLVYQWQIWVFVGPVGSWAYGRSVGKQSVSGRAAGDTCGTSGTDGPSLGGFAIATAIISLARGVARRGAAKISAKDAQLRPRFESLS